jgi:hypothetical protein
VTISLDGGGRALADALTKETLAPSPAPEPTGRRGQPSLRTGFAVDIPPHSWRAFRIAN